MQEITYNEIKIAFDNFEEAIAMLKSIAHPVRLGMISQLNKHEQLSVKDIQELISLPQAVVSHHINRLKDAGVITYRKERKFKLHYLNDVYNKHIKILESIK